MRRTVLHAALLGLSLAAAGPAAAAGSETDSRASGGDLGRLTIIEPKEGMGREFEEGYKRHLEWHRRNDDPWSWLGWTIVMGERPGTFVDASFDHSAADLDAPIAPAEDRADNRLNTLPYAARVETYVVRQRRDLSPGLGDPAEHAMLQLFEYGVDPTRYGDFVEALSELRSSQSDVPFTWLEFVNGGEHARFWLLLPAAAFSELSLSGVDLLPAALSSGLGEETLGLLRSSVRQLRSEVLRFRPELSYSPRLADDE